MRKLFILLIFTGCMAKSQIPPDVKANYLGCGVTMLSSGIINTQIKRPWISSLIGMSIGISFSILTPGYEWNTVWGSGIGGVTIGCVFNFNKGAAQKKRKHYLKD